MAKINQYGDILRDRFSEVYKICDEEGKREQTFFIPLLDNIEDVLKQYGEEGKDRAVLSLALRGCTVAAMFTHYDHYEPCDPHTERQIYYRQCISNLIDRGIFHLDDYFGPEAVIAESINAVRYIDETGKKLSSTPKHNRLRFKFLRTVNSYVTDGMYHYKSVLTPEENLALLFDAEMLLLEETIPESVHEKSCGKFGLPTLSRISRFLTANGKALMEVDVVKLEKGVQDCRMKIASAMKAARPDEPFGWTSVDRQLQTLQKEIESIKPEYPAKTPAAGSDLGSPPFGG